MRKLASLTLHAERLHVEAVWGEVERLATAAAGRGVRLTFFVHPFWALAAGVDIAPRVARLGALGHEIGQHTHFYDEKTGRVPGHKAGDLHPANVTRRLEEDHAALRAAGVVPRGFVAGAWAVPAGLPSWLAERGFRYECSLRTYAPATSDPQLGRAPAPFLLRGGLGLGSRGV